MHTDEIRFCRRDRAIYGWLSNFAPSPIRTRRATPSGAEAVLTWPTVEHYFQAQKVRDPGLRERIRTAPNPAEARRLGKHAALRPDWERRHEAVMLAALRAKFRPGSQRAAQLLATGEATIVEDAPWDSYWGTGRDGRGRNRLGELLMRVRAELAAPTTPPPAAPAQDSAPPINGTGA